MNDIVTGARKKNIFKKPCYEKRSPLRESQQGIMILDDGSKAYFITLKNLTSQIENPTCDIDKFTKEIILVVNAYLDEYPFLLTTQYLKVTNKFLH